METYLSDEEVVCRVYLKRASDQIDGEQVLSWLDDLNHPPLENPLIWWQCQTAFIEAFDNILTHAHHPLNAEATIELEAIRWCDRIEMKLWDYGSPCDLKQKLSELPDLMDNSDEHGRGLHIINRIADQWHYTPTEDDRNCFFILKYL